MEWPYPGYGIKYVSFPSLNQRLTYLKLTCTGTRMPYGGGRFTLGHVSMSDKALQMPVWIGCR